MCSLRRRKAPQECSSRPRLHSPRPATTADSLRVPLTGGEYNLAVPLIDLTAAFGKGGAAELYFRSC